MSDNVYIKSGEQPRYFGFSAGNYATGTEASTAVYKESPYSAFQAIVTGTSGSVAATVAIQVSNEEATGQGTKSNWITIGTITLTGTTSATDGFTTICPWRFVRASVSGVSGTSAIVEVIMGV